MANITELHPIRYAQDYANFEVTGLIRPKESNSLDLSYADKVLGITIDTVPENTESMLATCDVRFIFKTTNSAWFKLNSDGTANVNIAQSPSVDSVLGDGNTIAELRALTDIPAFQNTKLQYAVGMRATDIANMKPKVKFSVQCKTMSQQLVLEAESPEYEFDSKIIITNIEADTYIEGGGGLELQGRYYIEDESHSEYSEWKSLPLLVGLSTTKLQYKVRATVSEIGNAQALLRSIKTEYNEGTIIAASSGTASIVTVTEDWRVNLKQCRIIVKHTEVNASYIKAYVTFRPKTYKVVGEVIGTGTGQRTNYELSEKGGIKLDTVRMYYDGVSVPEGYDVNCETGQIIVNAPSGVSITCDYEYGYGDEQWYELELDSCEQYDRYYQSTYRITMPDDESGVVRSIAGIKVDLHTVTGREENELIGYGTGDVKTYRLKYPVRSGLITVRAGGVELPASGYEIQSDTRYIKINAGSGVELRCDYEWESEGVRVYEVAGIFSE